MTLYDNWGHTSCEICVFTMLAFIKSWYDYILMKKYIEEKIDFEKKGDLLWPWSHTLWIKKIVSS